MAWSGKGPEGTISEQGGEGAGEGVSHVGIWERVPS